MKNLKTTFAIMMIVGLLGISQAFACKSPVLGMLSSQQLAAASKTGAETVPPTKDDAQSALGYTRRDLIGRYASFAQATIFDPTTNTTSYATCIGVVMFDGRGHFTDKEVHSYGGYIVRDQFVGTYTVNSDGTGKMHYIGEAETYDQEIVLSNEAKDITFLILLDSPGIVSQGTMKKQ